jgi:hypothetical protein
MINQTYIDTITVRSADYRLSDGYYPQNAISCPSKTPQIFNAVKKAACRAFRLIEDAKIRVMTLRRRSALDAFVKHQQYQVYLQGLPFGLWCRICDEWVARNMKLALFAEIDRARCAASAVAVAVI